MDPTKRLYENRNIIREKNLKENREIWKFIIDNIEEKDVITTAKNHETLVFKIDNKKFHNQNIKDLNNIEKVLTSVASQIFKINSIEFNTDEIKKVNLLLIKRKIRAILNSPSEIQAHFCKNPNKQTCDETLQTEMLNEKIDSLSLNASKAKPNMYIFDGKFTDKNEGAKSIDTFIANKNITSEDFFSNLEKYNNSLIMLGYQKTIMVAGGHQNNQLKDILSFINQADQYIKNNNNRISFFVQADGDYCVDNMQKIRKEIINKNKIFAGTTTDIIDWIINVSKKI